MKNLENLIDKKWEEFLKFFRKMKGYKWTEKEILYSYNNNDIQEFADYLKKNKKIS